MKSADLFKRKTVFSLEIFPPKRTDSVESIYTALDQLKNLSPDFISVTYGAAGNNNSNKTIEIAQAIKTQYGIPSVAHLPCFNLTKQQTLEIIHKLKENHISNILALRGDVPDGQAKTGDFKYASDLIRFIKEYGDFNIIAACYPEGHFESKNIVEDTKNLRKKIDAGVDHLISQLFFDNDYFYAFRERCDLAGINVPIEAGIMPVVNKKQIERMTTLCKVKLPKKFVSMMTKFENNPIAMRDAGIAYACDQIVDLVTNGVQGIHLYTMNNPYIAQKIYSATATLINAVEPENILA